MKNPVKKVGKEALEMLLGISMTVPEEATEVRYSIIGEKVAQIIFQWEGKEMFFRASKVLKEFAGVYEAFTGEGKRSKPGGIAVRFTVSGGSLAQWSLPESKVAFSLYCREGEGTNLVSTLYSLHTPERERTNQSV